MMDCVTGLLFGEFPRTVAAAGPDHPSQFYVHSEAEFDSFFDAVRNSKNSYTSIGRYNASASSVMLDKVSIDLDSPFKDAAFPDEIHDAEKVSRMREDEDVAQTVLGQVVDDVRTLAQESLADDIPAIGVFSGMGVHFHQLYEAKESPGDEIASTVRMYMDQLQLGTVDIQPIGDVRRIMRVPNGQRIAVDGERTIPCGLWTVPFTDEELAEITVSELLERSTQPHDFEPPERMVSGRPSMQAYEDYKGRTSGEVESVELMETEEVEDAEIRWILEERVDMPCITERVKQSSPSNTVRFNFAVILFNLGYSVDDAVSIIRRMGWDDFDAKITRQKLQQIYNKGYSQMGCQTMQSQEMCVKADAPMLCDSYDKPGQRCLWK